MIPAQFLYNEERSTVADFPHLTPSNGLITILSTPQVMRHKFLGSFFNSFEKEFWILLVFSYFIIVLVSAIRVRSFSIGFRIALDYIVLMIGQSEKYLKSHSI